MKAFKFKLAAPLKWRKECERQAKLALQELSFERTQMESDIAKAEKEILSWIGAANNLNSSNPNMDEIMLLERYLILLNQLRERKIEEMRLMDKRIEVAKMEFAETIKKRKQLDYVFDKDRKEYEHDISKEEQKMFDDMSAVRSWRRDHVAEGM